MSENKPEKLNSQAVPFFARFLEGQSLEDLSEEESKAIIGGGCNNNGTNKNKDELVTTLKFPSDQEEGAVITKPDKDDYAVTQKYPSDGDDSSVS
ncbi:microviridin/marinostatin family tricyclic proteinase inhibitor [Nostoc sp. DedQUE09]|uniref:microviridin/marinostatin family tricyclic proteinase inhibitor n=1 Tax=Nostoc sp. DedQUE09 TaxID=3075394 RepID=UPI002AD57C20|nr:microviridin/marinostatin family tricyclic proteinase inhibitor [Nostoc sp. DedQUE09]MDZ7955767.1 microviridin/marinostatin family tricyclic proteinase inhibitor [Nostoc sp. DedQUE09]